MSDTPKNYKDCYRGISIFLSFLYSRSDIDGPAIGPSTAKMPHNDVDGPQTGPSTSFAQREERMERGAKGKGKEAKRKGNVEREEGRRKEEKMGGKKTTSAGSGAPALVGF